MSYKVKSLLYFSCFLAAITMYYSLDNELQIDTNAENVELAEMHLEDLSSDNSLEIEKVR